MGKYFCEKCYKNHVRGKIYKEHLQYKKSGESIKKKVLFSKIKLDNINFKTLRPVARRQISRLLKKMKTSDNNGLYRDEIKKIIIYEKGL